MLELDWHWSMIQAGALRWLEHDRRLEYWGSWSRLQWLEHDWSWSIVGAGLYSTTNLVVSTTGRSSPSRYEWWVPNYLQFLFLLLVELLLDPLLVDRGTTCIW